jgi:glyoxylase-like metal-dependent hydrolase (beta-lactamase superfamily II)
MVLEDEFGDVIQKARQGLGLNEKELAEKIGLKEQDIKDIETYKLKPEDKVDILAKTLNLHKKKLLIIMKEEFNPQPKIEDDDFEVFVVTSEFPSNAYIIADKKTKECIVIDTAGDPGLVQDKVDENKLKPLAILLTHSHSDHIEGVKALERVFEVQSYIYPSRLYSSEGTIDLKDNQTLEFSKFNIKILFTPGHTQDSCCFLINDLCFTGDTIFAGSIGRPNWGHEILIDAIEKKIFTLDNEVILLPGHGPITTVVEEKNNNPFFQ